MSFLGIKLAKLALFALLAFAWGVFCEATGRDLRGRPKQQESDTPDSQDEQQH